MTLSRWDIKRLIRLLNALERYERALLTLHSADDGCAMRRERVRLERERAYTRHYKLKLSELLRTLKKGDTVTL
jgi:hypothetical protein